MEYKLILGNRIYSSWSLRAWLMFKSFGISFQHRVVPLYTSEFEAFQADCFPARQVPVLLLADGADTTIVWDSLAIAELLHERHPRAGFWPSDPDARATARSLCAEMHSGFRGLRSTMPMNLKRTYSTFQPSPEAVRDIERISNLWNWAADRWGGGPYLFGSEFTLADAFFTPVAARFRTYSIKVDAMAETYTNTLLSHPDTAEFREDAIREPWIMEHNEFPIDWNRPDKLL